MSAATPEPAAGSGDPVFGFVLVGGGLSGALVRDVRLANELFDRGFGVRVWWAIDRAPTELRPQIRQTWLFHGLRYLRASGSDSAEAMGRLLCRVTHQKNRHHFLQKRPWIIRPVMERIIRRACAGAGGDRRGVRRFARELSAAGITHLMPMLEVICCWAAAACARMQRPPRYLVTFQGYELYGNYARPIGLERELYDRLAEVVAGSDLPAVAVSTDYAARVSEDIGIPPARLRTIEPGVPPATPMDRQRARTLVTGRFPGYRAGVPLVTYLGRRDVEKGIDLLLYAASILRARGVDLQVVVCGPTLFGDDYSAVCRQLADDLRLPVLWSRQVSDEVRTALYVHSRCIVYPSIHREPFGMVAAEALAHGTPAIVPDYGGVAGAIHADGRVGGLLFRPWDSADLADKLGRVIGDDRLHRRLSEAGPAVAAHYSVGSMADRVLSHLGCPPRAARPNDR
jgi:glycosyltransferase involved in cell wall biosynthesis